MQFYDKVMIFPFTLGNMPAPEQTPTEEELQQTTQESSTSPGMETEATAITILASVKEQVFCSFLSIPTRNLVWVGLNILKIGV